VFFNACVGVVTESGEEKVLNNSLSDINIFLSLANKLFFMRIFPILFALMICICCQAQNNTTHHHHFNLLSIKDGMPEATVEDMLQDKQGYIWIGTQKGLVRYDGYKLKIYDLGIKDPYEKFVAKIFEDSKGQLWAVALSFGLYRYDRGKDSFVSYLQWKKTGGISDGIEDASGNIWLSKEDTLLRFNPVTKKSEIFSSKAKGKYRLNVGAFYQLYKDKKQRIWVCSDNGLYEYNAKENTFIAHLAHSDSSKQITTWLIQEDAQQSGFFYFDVWDTYPGLNEGFGRYNSNTDSLTVFRHNPKDAGSLANDTLTSLYTDSKGRIWISTNSGLSLFDPSSEQFINYFPEPVNAFENSLVPIAIKEDNAGNLWLNSSKGLYSFNINTKQFQRDTTEINFTNGLADNYIHHLFIDKSGVVWFGANQYGLQWIDTRRSRWIQYGNGASADIPFKGGPVNYLTKAADGSIWLAAKNGLYRQALGDSFTLIKYLPGTGKNMPVRTDNFISNGLICWVTDPVKPGFYCYDPFTGKTIDFHYNLKDTALALPPIESIYKDHFGNIWIGTWGQGIWKYSTTKTFTKLPFIENNNTITDAHGALDDDQVECIYEDKEGVLWVGTNNGGLNRFNRDKETFTSYVGKSQGFNCVININEDSKGRLWASTYFGGLFELDKNRDSIKRFSEENGLLFDGALATKEDNKGNIWAATPRGISIIDPVTGKITNITGINNFNLGSGDHIAKTNDGKFYIATDNGFITLNPDDFASDKEPPVVHIESMHITKLVKNKPVDSAVYIDTATSYNLHHNENRLTFNYVGLYYKAPLATQYAYKLDGYDKDWVQAGTQRTVTYTNLSPGTYTFHVKAANADGVWSTKDDSITIIISPPWWETWWAYLLYAIVAAIAVWTFVAYRSRALKQHNKILEHKVQLRTAEVLEQKEELATQRDHLEEALKSLQSTQAQLIQSEKMASLGELTAGIAHEIQNPLNFVNNFSEVNNELIEEMNNETDIHEIKTIANDIKQNNEKIAFHGKRADAIVKNMLQHSKQTKGTKEPTDINALCDEYLRLAYHGMRAKDKSFNADFKTEFDESIGKINIVPQDIGRVLLNLFNNAFYAVNEKTKLQAASYKPHVIVQTKKINNVVEIIVKDNGNGIPQNVIDKIFQPFFTTKPTGSGTGLGLSLSYDIIKAHSGEIKVTSKENEGTEFIITLIIC
jgi:signal transduction histidine kinase/ligand-binding sensor domain-containing protein